MKKRISKLLVGLIVMGFFSCEKEELPVKPHSTGNMVTGEVSMESDYRYQLYFDLETNSMVQQNLKVIWDLGFETSANGYHVVLNSAKMMAASNTGETNMNSVIDTAGLHFNWDVPSGNIDSTAIGNWASGEVFVIDRGYDPTGAHQGFKKMILQSYNSIEYQIDVANLDGSDAYIATIPKDESYNLTFFSLDNAVVEVEPLKEDWDLSFTQYTHIFNEVPPSPYLVTGALANRNGVQVARLFDKEFDEITADDINDLTFSESIDVIGYNWKFYDFGTSSYTVHSNQNYIIKSTEEKYYKLHFIDFYDDMGQKGTPTFEFQEL